jgi:phage shock protein C
MNNESDLMSSKKRLYKSEDPLFAGVCGGIADFFDIDPTLVRILTVILVLAGFGLPIIAYIIAMLLMPKRTPGYADYIDVKPATATASSATASAQASSGTGVGDAPNAAYAAQATADFSTTSGAASSAGAGSAPGSGYTACNPQAYNCHSDQPAKAQGHHGLRSGITLGILLVGVGILALVGTFINVSVWRFWPVFLIIAGFITLCTPGRSGWSLERAGNGISIMAVGAVLQLWMFELVGINAFFLTFLNLWPILLVVVGLSIIGSATEQSIFKLFGSILFSLALLIGVWNFGNVGGPLSINLPGEHGIEILIPSPGFSSEGTLGNQNNR